jgi:hypothetical protein
MLFWRVRFYFQAERRQRSMAQNNFRRFRYTAGSINLFGLMLSVGTWAFKVWLRTHTLSGPYWINFIWTLGVFCWVLGLLLFSAAWIAEGFASDRGSAQ